MGLKNMSKCTRGCYVSTFLIVIVKFLIPVLKLLELESFVDSHGVTFVNVFMRF